MAVLRPNSVVFVWLLAQIQKSGLKACKCEKYFFDFELIPVKGHNVKKMKYYCSDCIVNNVNWCDNCGFAYEIGNPEEDIDLCSDCMQEVLTSAKNN